MTGARTARCDGMGGLWRRLWRRLRRREWRREWHQFGGDRGSATGWAVGLVLVGLLLSALVFDGAAAMTAKASALQLAQQAARAGAAQLDLVTLRQTGEIRLDPPAAEAAAREFVDQTGATGEVEWAGTATATTAQVTVTITATSPTVLLAAVGIGTFTVSATATAEPVQP